MANSKTAIVTGAGTGIGKAVATALAAAGWTTVFTGRRRELLDAAVDYAGANGGRAAAIACDVTKAEAVDRLFEETAERFGGRIDLLFNNAGMSTKSTPIDEIPVELWQAVVDVNLTGSFLCARKAFQMMRRQRPMGGASSTTARSRPMRRAPAACPTRPPSMPSPGSPRRWRSTAGRSTSPAARSTSAMR